MNREELDAALDAIGVDESDKAYVLMKFDQSSATESVLVATVKRGGIGGHWGQAMYSLEWTEGVKQLQNGDYRLYADPIPQSDEPEPEPRLTPPKLN